MQRNLTAELPFITTMSEEQLARTLEMSAARLASLSETIAQSPNSTIEPEGVHPSRRSVVDLGGERSSRVAEGLVLGATIGEGGMGIVRSATQRSLGRRVAVKTLRPELKNEDATLRLLREAWVTGSLEHPNIVPVYDLGYGEDAAPVIVLKHIEGLPWSELIHDLEEVKARFGVDDRLEWCLRILVQLCHAVSLAHARGIIHRDLKPENVMIGRFGEVYLVDWGIAVSLRDDPTGRLPLASHATELAGTPSYMAPEMLGGMGKLGERTDVYLLGAVLYEILVGHPPHRGTGFREIVASILLSRFEFPAHVAPDLAAIATRAMSRAPDDRFASADELRQRIEWYLRHRGSLVLSAEAMTRVEEMRSVLATRRDAVDVRERIHHLFAEARFGFRQAARACADNEAAELGLRQATEMVVLFELDEGLPEAAAAALAELESPPAALVRRVGEAMRSRDAERQRIASLEKLRADLDPATGRRTRMTVSLAVGSMWTIALELIGWWYRRQPAPPRWALYILTASVLAFSAIVSMGGRQSLRKTAINRGTAVITIVMFAMQLTLEVASGLLGMSDSVMLPLHLYGWFFSVAVYTLFVDRRFWPSVVAVGMAFLTACLAPSGVWHAMSAAAFAATLNFAGAWSQPREDADFLRDRMKAQHARRRGDGRPTD